MKNPAEIGKNRPQGPREPHGPQNDIVFEIPKVCGSAPALSRVFSFVYPISVHSFNVFVFF